MLFDDSIADAQTEPCSLPDRLRREERIENLVWIFHARAAVGNLHTNSPAARCASNPDVARPALFLNCVNGVVQDIQKHLLQLVWIRSRHRQIAVEISMNPNVVQL